MKKLTSVLLALVLVFASLALPAAAENAGVVNVFNWEDYICEDVLQMFEQETGIKVNYMRFTTNEDMMVQVRADSSKFDVVFPSDYCIERLAAEGLLEEIDFSKITNFNQIADNLLNPDYDKENKYSIPYMWGTVGILYNSTMVKEPITSWASLFDGSYPNNIFMMDSIRDSMGVALKYLGYSMNSKNPLELEAAKEVLVKQKKDGLVKAYQVDETKDKMVAGEAALGVMWTGDALYAIDLNPDLEYVIPEEGSNIWVDGMVIPKNAENYENALKFIDFLCRPDIAKMNCEEIWYSCPNKGAIELMGSDYIDNLDINPPEEIIEKCEFFSDVNDVLPIYTALWNEVKNSK
ncbi:MAG: spermidine/putrescine ABC transporter substrate-binding protein [Eubacteriales bacterium]|nr:spermidine/putrescine ABC transporter substrate-binding protein [Eubacteriales bacterium]MDD3882009.1 spermidine/putrescine ABC transporter substrate-binding protein [Eubacteriales bacterium]MDD4513713.1 spermidine/putrescine ABC transporter substrate-binding protein [Eubacteriales bacterium]